MRLMYDWWIYKKNRDLRIYSVLIKIKKIDEIDDYAYLYKNENLNWKGKMVREKPDHAQ